ncbi:cysteine peptidase family C39 domain-containing protein [Flavobacterium aurantiibacter]|uniref:Peptidase C39 domain-containing protein n=1 Tax=Flavobacterium aurantiibacter TaxID=2023067 RepID=A0A256A9T0_9FLAO|nr:cysteine peptidase family C39 domain-containing protein [Flavobacterium aurantiibacter]OYQ49904.1 hypothetical protein CHX27_01170 [Flavobacterium aurantiibacter]
MENKIVLLLYRFIQLNNYSIDLKTLQLQFLSHADYPSFRAISDTLDYFNIQNIAAQIPVEAFDELPFPLIAILNNEDYSKITVVEKKSDNNFVATDEKLTRKKLTKAELLRVWSGFIIAAEYSTEKVRKTDRYSISIITLVTLLSVFTLFVEYQNWVHLTYLLSSIVGCGISWLIFKEKLGEKSLLVDKVCGLTNKKDGCAGIINDKSSNLIFGLTFSDASMIYFSWITLTLVMFGYNALAALVLGIFGLFVSIYSWYLQGKVLKSWCSLCLGISSILIFQFITSIIMYRSPDFSLAHFLQIGVVFILVGIAWYYFSTQTFLQKDYNYLEISATKFKRNQSMFEMLLNKRSLKQPLSMLDDSVRFRFGSTDPKIVITAVTNPLCGFCVETFQSYEKMLSKYSFLQLNLIFSVPNIQPDNPGVVVLRNVIEIYKLDGKESSLKSLSDWFMLRDLNIWLKNYSRTFKMDSIKEVVLHHGSWIEENEITGTPTTIINNHFYPTEYKLSDFDFFITEIKDSEEHSKAVVAV